MTTSSSGHEWIVEAYGCHPVRLADPATLHALFGQLIAELALHPVGAPHWHQFPAPSVHVAGGMTGMVMLSESHLTIHTFPEHGSACLNLFCCTPRAEWPWAARLGQLLGATDVRVRHLGREYAPLPIAAP
jgi:S-adenosylmethionine decarboxylase